MKEQVMNLVALGEAWDQIAALFGIDEDDVAAIVEEWA